MSEDVGAPTSTGLGSGTALRHTVGVDEPAVPDLVCSARACSRHAVWALRWNNPKLHTPERRKTWLACEDHLESLSQFLSMRGFLRETMDAEALPRH
jgi:hypothetical protein